MVELARRHLLGAAAAGLAAPALIGRARPVAAAAPMQGPSTQHYRRVALGDFEVTILRDGAITVDGPETMFGTDQDAATVRALAEENLLPPEQLSVGFAPVLINTGEQVILLDTGNGPDRAPNAANTKAALEASGVTADQVDVVMITHMHPDHIGGLMTDGAATYPNARYVTNAAEFDFWTNPDLMGGPAEGVAKLVQANVVPLAEKFTFIKAGDDIASGVAAVEASGHTPGHTAVMIESGGKQLLVWADAANHFVLSVQRPDWHFRFDMDNEKAAATRKRLFDMAAADRLAITGYHMPFPSIGYVSAAGSSYRYTPMSYQFDL